MVDKALFSLLGLFSPYYFHYFRYVNGRRHHENLSRMLKYGGKQKSFENNEKKFDSEEKKKKKNMRLNMRFSAVCCRQRGKQWEK